MSAVSMAAIWAVDSVAAWADVSEATWAEVSATMSPVVRPLIWVEPSEAT